MTIWLFIRKKLMFFKQYITRTTTYLSVINAGMIFFLFLSKLKDDGVINFPIDHYYVIIVIIGIIILLLVGWFEMKVLKGMQEENTINFYFQPPMVDLKNKIDEMYEQFKINQRRKR